MSSVVLMLQEATLTSGFVMLLSLLDSLNKHEEHILSEAQTSWPPLTRYYPFDEHNKQTKYLV